MKLLVIKLTFLCVCCYQGVAQTGKKAFQFKKGEVLDVLLVTGTKNNYKKLFDRYKKTAFPVASKFTYQPQSGFRTKKLIMGSHLPVNFIFGKWSDIKKRKEFLRVIENEVPDFHRQRKELFTYFGLAYFEVENNVDFSIYKNKFNVVTSFWKKKKDKTDFYKVWENSVKKNGGKVILKLENGESPTGYYYRPDIISIVEWETYEQFDSFSKKYPLSSYARLSNVHQFQID